MKGKPFVVYYLDTADTAAPSTMDLSRSILPSEPPTPPTRTSEALKSDLRNVNSQLSSMKREWESERQQLIAEKGVLQDVANKLNDKIRTFTADAAKEKSNQAHHRSDIQAVSVGACCNVQN